MASSPSRSTRETLPRPTFDPFSSFGLPPNSALSSLPPLPDTPRHEKRSFAPGTFDPPASARSNHTSTISVSRHERMGDLAGMLGDDAVDVDDNVNAGAEALGVGSHTRRAATDTVSKRDLFSPPKYPVLSTRQSSINLARTQTTPYKRSPTKHTSHFTPAKIPLPLSPEVHPTTLHLPPPSPSPYKSSVESPAESASPAGSPSRRSVSGSFQLPVIPDVSLLGEITLPAGRESLGSDIFDLGVEALRPRPTNLPDDDEIGYAKSKAGGSTTPTRATGVGKGSATPTRTHPRSATRHAVGGGERLDESTLLPSTPAGMVDLLSSTNALSRVPPPWIPSNSTRSTNTVHATAVVDPSTALPRGITPGSIAGVAPAAIAAPPAPSITISKSSSQRTLPASASSSSLTSVGEEVGDQQPLFTSKGNESALFPVSPAKHRHLLSDDEQLIHEAPIDGPSIYLHQPRRTPVDVGEGDKSTLFPVSPQKYRHLLADNEQLTHETPIDEASLLMPPPRLPAASSSFPSIRQETSTSASASTGPSHLDKSAMFPTSPAKWRHLLSDEEQLVHETPFPLEGASVVLPPPPRHTSMTSRTAPSPMKPKPVPSRQGSPQKVRSSPVKLPFGSYTPGNVAGGDVTLDVGEMMAMMSKPKRPSGTEESFIDLLHGDHNLDDFDETVGDESFLPAGLRPLPLPRSKSMPGIALARSPTKSSAPPKISPSKTMAFAQESTVRSRTLSRPEPAVAAPTSTTTITTTTPGASRTRGTVAPQTTGTRRISLSAGNVPMPKSASMKTLDLPPPTPRSSQPRLSAHAGHARSKSTSMSLPSTGTAAATKQSMVPPTSLSGRSLGPSSRAVSRARPSFAPPAAPEPRTRLGSTTSLAPAAPVRPVSSRMAPPQNLPITSKLSSRPSVVPTRSSAASAPAGRSAGLPSSKGSKPPVPVDRASAMAAMPPPSLTARPGGLPRPAAAERVIPTTTSSRTRFLSGFLHYTKTYRESVDGTDRFSEQEDDGSRDVDQVKSAFHSCVNGQPLVLEQIVGHYFLILLIDLDGSSN
ncbi:hypothetical protein JCM24511_02469 [Saitozyma sp. JCM 24511]|nr:hypothetical protein JCM24511_02469 [Saitozyma sp. JCM 24511]